MAIVQVQILVDVSLVGMVQLVRWQIVQVPVKMVALVPLQIHVHVQLDGKIKRSFVFVNLSLLSLFSQKEWYNMYSIYLLITMFE